MANDPEQLDQMAAALAAPSDSDRSELTPES